GLAIARQIRARDLVKNSYDSFIELYSKQNDFKKAFEYYLLYSAVKDSIYSENSARRIAEMQIRFETEQKIRENEIIKLELEKQKLVKWRLYFGFAAALALVIIVYYFYRLKNQANKDLIRKVQAALDKQNEQQQIIMHQAGLTALGELAAGIAHEINQPLQNIAFTTESLYLDCQNNEVQPPEMKNNLKDLREDINRIRMIIDHVRDFSREQKDEMQREFDVNDCVNNALKLLSTVLTKNQIVTRLDLTPDLDRIKGNPYKLEQVLLNLISNSKDAIMARIESGDDFPRIIAIKSYKINSIICIEVHDTGSGISPEIKNKVFHPFFTTKRAGKGTGLGLSISYGIIREMGGEITFSSQPGEGTYFSILIPHQNS
ncbi:MAG: hypothetical protein JXB60_04985, partial [Candidatus Cloacimonetes bacterium]|nr:hypothetical protein [Candidatus Cloacimonadota bacterium]